jgi:hypothetical protein
VQGFPSLQLMADPWQEPPEQASSEVHALPSLQGSVLLVNTQPVAGLQESSVHALPSLQVRGAPAQTPPEHTSPVVQALPSLHAAVLFECAQPVA